MMWVASARSSDALSEARRWRPVARFGRAGGPPPVAHGGAAPAHHHYRPSGAPVGLIVGLIAAGLAVILLVVGLVGSRSPAPTFAELKAKLGIAPNVNPAGLKMPQVDYMNRLGTPNGREETPTYIYHYYTIQEGTAVIVLDRGGWEVDEARIRQMYAR